jgi:hypothetical protein
LRAIIKTVGLLLLVSLFAMPGFALPTRIQVSNNGVFWTVFEGDPGPPTTPLKDLSAFLDAVTFMKKTGNWEINAVTGTVLSTPFGGLTLSSSNTNNWGAGLNPGTLTVWFTQLDVTTPTTSFNMSLGGTNTRKHSDGSDVLGLLRQLEFLSD